MYFDFNVRVFPDSVADSGTIFRMASSVDEDLSDCSRAQT
jgi:hypothetical protein